MRARHLSVERFMEPDVVEHRKGVMRGRHLSAERFHGA
jgi:hypothetical protein